MEFLGPGVGGELGEEGGEIPGPIEVREGLAKARPEDMIDGREIVGSAVAKIHAKPAGTGQSGE
jgi:hypothetical protein